MPRYCDKCGIDAPNAGQCGDVVGERHHFVEEGNSNSFLIITPLNLTFEIVLISHLISPSRCVL
jgi:hypothetical protein